MSNVQCSLLTEDATCFIQGDITKLKDKVYFLDLRVLSKNALVFIFNKVDGLLCLKFNFNFNFALRGDSFHPFLCLAL